MKKREKKEYVRGNKKIDNFDEVVDVTKEHGEKVKKKATGFWADFKKFAISGNIVDLAVAVIIGTAFGKIVNSLVSNILTPLTSKLLPKGDISMLKVVLDPAVEANPELGIEAVPEVAITYGVFLESIIDFFIIALSIFLVLRVFLKFKERIHRKKRLEAEARAKEEAAKKKAEADAEAARLEKIKQDFIDDVAIQADMLKDIRDIMLRMESAQADTAKAKSDN